MAKYRLFLLQLTGFALIVAAVITLGKLALLSAGWTPIVQYGGIALVTFILGISLASPRHMPRFLATPMRRTDPLMVVFVLVGIGIGIVRFAEWSVPLMPQADFLKPMAFAGVVAIGAAILYLPILVPEMFAGVPREERPEEMSSSEIPAKAETASRNPNRRSATELLHLMLVRLTGLAIVAAAAWPVAMLGANSVEIGIATGMAALAALLLLIPRLTPNVLSRPIGFFAIFGVILYAVLIFILAMGPLALHSLPPAELVALADLRATPDAWMPTLQGWAADPAKEMLVMAATVVGGLFGLMFLTSLILLFQAPSLVTRKERFNPGASKLPALGWIVKLYNAADWVLLRILGVLMLATAWLLYQAFAAETGAQPELLAYGLDTTQAMLLYGVAGGMLALPFLLPRFLAAPRHVFFGMVKAVMLVGAGIILLPVLPVLIDSYVPAEYQSFLPAALPDYLKMGLGVALVLAIMAAFFRHLAGPPRVDYMGRPIVAMSEKDLREMRSLRMG
ncbi:MAG: hypothetical protein AAF919_09060 [Pseudomonadota bacterium]